MANMGTLKKRAAPPLSAVLVPPSEDWELHSSHRSWDMAETYRNAIVNETQRSARIRFANGDFLVEWKS